jgi:hypothetical protein
LPQAMSCDLHRNIDRYAFVGNMRGEFMFDVERMASQFGGQLPELLNASFEYMERVGAGKKNNIEARGLRPGECSPVLHRASGEERSQANVDRLRTTGIDARMVTPDAERRTVMSYEVKQCATKCDHKRDDVIFTLFICLDNYFHFFWV